MEETYFCNVWLDSNGEEEIKTYFIYHTKNGRYYERVQEERRTIGEKHFHETYTGVCHRISEKVFIAAWETYKNA